MLGAGCFDSTGLRLFQYPDDLLLAKSPLHFVLLFLLEQNYTFQLSSFWGSGHTCFKADYAALKADPRHRLHDYFHVVEYSTWSHEIIGEATLKRTDYPSAEAVDGAIARTQAEWETELQNHLKQTPDTDTRTTIPASTGDNFPVPYGEAFIINTNVYAARFRQVLFDIKTYQKANDEQAIAETLRVPSGMDSLAEAIEIKKGTTVYYMGLDPFVDQKIIKVRFFGSGQTWDVLAADLKDFRYNNRDYTSFLGSYSPIEK